MDEPTPWSLTSLREKLIKISAKVVSQPGTSPLQIAEVAVLRQMFRKILPPIARLRQRRQQRCASIQQSCAFQRLGAVN
jgi:hypothetical protein